MALIAGYTLTPAHIGGPWSLTGPYTDAQNTQVLLRYAHYFNVLLCLLGIELDQATLGGFFTAYLKLEAQG